MALQNQNFKMFQGDEETISFDLTGSTDITNATITWKMGRNLSDSADVTKTGSAITVTDGTARTLTVDLTKADTVNLTPGFYQHELIVDVSNTEITEASGIVTLLPSSK